MKSTSDDLFALIDMPFGANQARFRELLRKYGTETTNDEGIKESFSGGFKLLELVRALFI